MALYRPRSGPRCGCVVHSRGALHPADRYPSRPRPLRLPGLALSCRPPMTKDSSLPPVEHGEGEPPTVDGAAMPAAAEAPVDEAVQHGAPLLPLSVFTASHEVLFQVLEETACDACGRPLPVG